MGKFNIKHIIKSSPTLMNFSFRIARLGLNILSFFTPVKEKTIMFVSFSGRKFDDSPRAIYEYILNRPEFDDWNIFWGLVNPNDIHLERGNIVKFGTFKYWKTLLSCKVWIGNGGIDKGVDFRSKKSIILNTWHGTPMKRICGEENSNQVLKSYREKRKIDSYTLRCCQSEYDKKIFERVFRADPNCFIMSGLPRNDNLLEYSENSINTIKKQLGIPLDKRVILYMPTYREYLINENYEHFIAPPFSIDKWKEQLSSDYCLLIRAHYMVAASMGIKDDGFIKDVSSYAPLNDLYAVADIMISDYSSSFFDYAILGRPMRCFAYDYEIYEKERGFYFNPADELPCDILKNEDDVIKSILDIDYNTDCVKSKEFAQKFLPNEGTACETVINKILELLK